jgi:hypothetical protein
MDELTKSTVPERARKRQERIASTLSYSREIGRKCREFVAGNQWEEGDLKNREDRVVITDNKLATYVNNTANKQAMQAVDMKALPNEENDRDTARVINGLLRHIQHSQDSEALEAWLYAYRSLIEFGEGYFMVDADYTDESSNDQDLLIKKIEDPETVFLDPDRRFGMILRGMDREVYEETYGQEPPSEGWDLSGTGVTLNEDEVLVAEYYEKTLSPVDLLRIEIPPELNVQADMVDVEGVLSAMSEPQAALRGPQIIDVFEDELEIDGEDENGNPIKVPKYPVYTELARRKSHRTTVTRYIICGDEVVDETERAGKHLPIIGMYGLKYMVDGRIFHKPLVYDGLDLQRLLNFEKSEYAEMLHGNVKAQFMGYEGQFVDHEEEFANVTQSVSYLEVKPVVGPDGSVLPFPQKLPPPAPSAGLIQSMAQTKEEIKEAIGIYDTNLGARSNEISGRAILARTEQGDTNTYHYVLELTKGIRLACKVCVDQIPHYYDTARTIRILGDDMADEVVKINQWFRDPKTNKDRIYDLTVGKYDIRVDIGPSTLTALMDQAENLMNLAKVVPTAAPVLGDVIAKNIAPGLSEDAFLRIKATVPPEILERVEQLKLEEKGVKAPNRMQQQLQQAVQAIKQLAQQNDALKKQLQGVKMQEAQLNSRTRLQETVIKTQGDIAREKIKASARMPLPPPGMPIMR